MLLAAVIAAATPALAASDAAPSPERLRALSAALDSATFVRVVARRGTFEVPRAFADTAGVRVLRSGGRTGLIVMGAADTTGREQRLLAWSEVERIQAGRSRGMGPALAGLALGGLVVGIAAARAGSQGGTVSEGTAPLLYGVGAVAVISTIVGLAVTGSPIVHTVYP